jgi:hypothetical protein
LARAGTADDSFATAFADIESAARDLGALFGRIAAVRERIDAAR